LAPRVHELETTISQRSMREVVTDALVHELASLIVLGQAMDETLESDGLTGRRGEPRRMIDLRLRLNDKLRLTLDQYARIQDQNAQIQEAAPFATVAEIDAHIELLAAELRRRQQVRESRENS
jgi:hypothetical protein